MLGCSQSSCFLFVEFPFVRQDELLEELHAGLNREDVVEVLPNKVDDLVREVATVNSRGDLRECSFDIVFRAGDHDVGLGVLDDVGGDTSSAPT